MKIMEMLGQSGILSVLGMGVVFGFLLILVITITFTGKFFGQKNPDNDGAGQIPKTNAPAKTTGNAQVTAAISAAVSEYRKSQ